MDAIRTIVAENLKGGNKAARGDEKSAIEQVPDLTGKVAVVTGGSEGIGYGCTHTLLSKNISKLFVLSPKKEVIDGAVAAIAEDMGQPTTNRVKWMQCDLSDGNATGNIAFEIAKLTDRLDILINNAARGIMTRQLAPNGVDLHMAINHMGHVVLTSHLLPFLKKTADQGHVVRIVNLASNAHRSAPNNVKFESLEELNRDHGPMPQYGCTKLAAILYSKYLARHLTSAHPKILVNATHPGIVDTSQTNKHILEPYPLGGYAMKVGSAPFKKSQFEGAISTIFAAMVTQNSRQYICPPAIVEQGSPQAHDQQLEEI